MWVYAGLYLQVIEHTEFILNEPPKATFSQMREVNMQHFMPEFFSYLYTYTVYIDVPQCRTSNYSIFKFVEGDSLGEWKLKKGKEGGGGG